MRTIDISFILSQTKIQYSKVSLFEGTQCDALARVFGPEILTVGQGIESLYITLLRKDLSTAILCIVLERNLDLLQDNYANDRVDILESESSVALTLIPTVPISCPPCSMTLRLVNPLGLTVSTCSLSFSSSDPPMTGRTVNIRAVPTAGSNSRVTRVQFQPVDTQVTGSGWDSHIVEPIPVCTLDCLTLNKGQLFVC